ncbi:MAG TPA: phage holin family protein [Solirubrobacteraceae bacterium]|nr:phage holin family protein [Solirubrobacteraceae bacterium]
MATSPHEPNRELERLNQEIRELRSELQRDRRRLPGDDDPLRLSVIATAAGVLALAAFTTFLIALLDTAMPLWVAALIVAVFYAPIALALRATVRGRR